MRLLPSLAMLLLCLILFIISSPSQAQPQSPPVPVPAPGPSRSGARSLDALLQDYAYKAFDRPRVVTGDVYDATVPSNLTGIKIAAMRLRCGSLRTRGVKSYKEFQIPMGIIAQPYVERLVLVYQNLGNWSQTYYPLPGYTYLTPVLGLIAYDAFNLKAEGLPELDIRASRKPISVEFNNVGRKVPDGEIAQCVWFDSDGLVQFSNVVSGNVCSTVAQGHFGIVIKGSPAPAPAPVAPSPSGGGGRGGRKKKSNSKVWKIVAAVIGGFLLLLLLGLLICCMQRYKRRKKMQQMEKAAEVGESLQMTSIGNTRAPIAMGTRTQPVIENEYVP